MKKLLKLFGCNNRRKKDLKENIEDQKEIPNEKIGNINNNKKNDVNSNDENSNKNNLILTSSSAKNEEEEINENEKEENYSSIGLITKPLDEVSNNENLILNKSKIILDYERNKITFTKKGFVDFFKYCENLDNYKNYWNKDNLTIDIRLEGSPISDKFCLIKTKYIYYKNEFNENINIIDLIKFQYDVNLRKKWDTAFKNIEKIEGSDEAFIVSSWAKSPIFLISEREGIEKRFIFKYEDNCYYVCSTSVPNNYIPLKKNVIRIDNYINFFRITEDNEKYILTTINQSDFKMIIPQSILNVTLPATSKSWFNNLKKFANNVIKDNGKYIIKDENEINKEEEKNDNKNEN
jgi:hypothetical protein